MPNIKAIVLAAGQSSRMHSNKMLLELSGRAVIHHTLDCILASKIKSIILVLGYNKELIESKLVNYDIEIIENHFYFNGMSTSIKAGIKHLMNKYPETDAVIFFLGDMPMIKPETVDQIVSMYIETGSHIVVPLHKGRRGHPVLFDKTLFSRLLELSGDAGARKMLKDYHNQVCMVEVDDPGINVDLDNWDDYLAAKQMVNS